MSREIFFKAKRKNCRNLPKEEWWVEGFYVPHIVDGEIVHYYILTGETSIEETKEDDLVLDFYTEEIDPNTLCQYTGLTDKNGKKIWENDILKNVYLDGNFKCEWDDDSARYVLNRDGLTFDFDNYWHYETEVIGNSFDNAELLEEI